MGKEHKTQSLPSKCLQSAERQRGDAPPDTVIDALRVVLMYVN